MPSYHYYTSTFAHHDIVDTGEDNVFLKDFIFNKQGRQILHLHILQVTLLLKRPVSWHITHSTIIFISLQ